MNGLTNEELIFLDNLIYLEFRKIIKDYEGKKELSVGTLIEEILLNIDECTKGNPACMSQEEWLNLLTAFSNNEKNKDFLDNYVIENYETHSPEEGGFRGCCFVKRDNEKNVEDTIVIFRGTSTNETEWTDNVLNANRVWSDPMDDAILYIDKLSSEEYGDNITVSGHSKGGNRAQYVTILRKDRIGRCLSFDGQGFSDEFIDLYQDEIAEKKSVITSISFEYDYVNSLLYPIAGEIKYIPGEADENYSLNHCPNRVFNEDGEFNTIMDSDGNVIQYLDEPFILSTLIAYITQKPVSEISEEDLNFVLEVVAYDFVVPLLVEGKKLDELELSVNDFAALKMLIDDLLLYCPVEVVALNIVEKLDPTGTLYTIGLTLAGVLSLVNWVDETKKKLSDNFGKYFDKKDLLNQAEQIISIYNAFQTSDQSSYQGSFEETLMNACFGGDSEYSLVELYKCYLNAYDSLVTDADFYESLNDYEIETLIKLISIIGEENHKDEKFDLMLERVYSQLAKAAVNNEDLMDKAADLFSESALFAISCVDTIVTAVADASIAVAEAAIATANVINEKIISPIQNTIDAMMTSIEIAYNKHFSRGDLFYWVEQIINKYDYFKSLSTICYCFNR